MSFEEKIQTMEMIWDEFIDWKQQKRILIKKYDEN